MFFTTPGSWSRATYLISPLLVIAALGGCSGHHSHLSTATAERLVEDRLGSVVAEPTSWTAATPLTADVAVSVAVRHDPALLVKLSEIASGRADVLQASVGPNPTVGFGIGIAIDGLAGAPLAARGMQGLTWLWQRPHLIAHAEAKLQATVLDGADHALTLVASTRASHAGAVAAAALNNLAIDDAADQQRLLDITQHLFDQGEANRSDVEASRSAVSAAHRATLQADDAFIQAKITLLGYLGVPTESLDFAVVPSPRERPADHLLHDERGSMEALWRLAMTNRLDLAAAAAGVDAALAHRLLSNLKRYPQLTASVRFAQSFSDREAILPGAELTLPIFDTGDAAVAKALAALDTAVATRDRVMQNIQSEVRSAMEAWSSLDTQLSRLEREELDLATSQLNRVRAHVNAGESDDSDQLRADLAWRRIQRQAITLTHKTAVASIELRRAVGGSWETHATIDTLSQRSDTP